MMTRHGHEDLEAGPAPDPVVHRRAGESPEVTGECAGEDTQKEARRSRTTALLGAIDCK